MAFTSVTSGQTVSGSTVSQGTYLEVYSGGKVISETDNGFIQVFSGGSATQTTVGSGFLQVSSGGVAAQTTVVSGFLETFAGGVASGVIVQSGFDQVAGGSESAGVISSGSFLEVSSNGTATGDTIQTGAFAIVSSGSLVSATISSGAYVNVYSAGTLVAANLMNGASVDLGGVAYASGATAQLNYLTDVLTISEGGVATQLQLAGSYLGESFRLSSDNASLTFGSGTAGTYLAVACYCPDTLILTDAGERAVETLEIGDVVVTAGGDRRPVRWVGRRSYAGRFLAANPAINPVRFLAGSLGDGLPRRDLLVSPDHAMFLEGVLVPARALVNGSTIRRERGLSRVDYFHVELDSHDVLLAEGAPAESYLDADNRMSFHNWAQHADLYPHSAGQPASCAPRVEDGAVLEEIRTRLQIVAEAA